MRWMNRRRPKKDTAKSDGSSLFLLSSVSSLITASCGGSRRRLTPAGSFFISFFSFLTRDNENQRGSQPLEEGGDRDRRRAACREDVSGTAKDQRTTKDGLEPLGMRRGRFSCTVHDTHFSVENLPFENCYPNSPGHALELWGKNLHFSWKICIARCSWDSRVFLHLT